MDDVKRSIRAAGMSLWRDAIGVAALTSSFFILLHVTAGF